MDRIARFLVQKSKVVLGLTALTTLSAVISLFGITLDADVVSAVMTSTDEGRAFLGIQQKYGATEPITVMIERADGGAMTDRKGLELVITVRDALKAVPGVAGVATLVPDDNPATGAPFTRATLDEMQDGMLPFLTASPAAALVVSEDQKAVLAMVSPGPDPIALGRALTAMTFPDEVKVTLAGNPIIFARVLEDLSWFLLAIPPSVIFLLLLVFAANIGSRRLAVLALVPAALGSVWTFGLITALGHQIDLVTVIVPIWVIVMGSADGLHFVTHLQEAAARTDDKVEQTSSALREVGLPMILTTVSTALGFLSMLAMDVGPMRALGTFAAIGISFAGIISFFFLPALLSRVKIEKPSHHAVGGRLTTLLATLAKTPVAAVVVVVACVAFGAIAIPQIRVSPDPLFFFKDSHPARVAFEKLAATFGGATPLVGELAFDPKGDVDAQLERFRELSRALEEDPAIRRVFSVADLASFLPDDKRQALMSGTLVTPMGRMVSDDGVRFVVFPRTVESEDLARFRAFTTGTPEIRVLTGQPVLFDGLSRVVADAQVRSLGLALLLLGAMLFLSYRRLATTVIALVPMVLTVVVLIGFLAVSGIHLNLVTALISSIVIGVAIDYVIHFFAAVERERARGDGYARRALLDVGRPILANALGIAVGMSALFLSPLRPHGQIAMVMWVSMLTGAVTTLVVVPALLGRRAVHDAAPSA